MTGGDPFTYPAFGRYTVTDEKTLDRAVLAIHGTLKEAEHQLSRLGERLQFLVLPDGVIEIVRRTGTGETVRPKVVIAELRGSDPMFWRIEHPRWLRVLDPERDHPAAPETAGESTPPAAGAAEESASDPAAPPAEDT